VNENPQYPQPYPPQPYPPQAPAYAPQAPPAVDVYSSLEQRVRSLEMRLPNTKLLANGFLSRAFAVWGHMFVAQLLIGLIVGVIVTIIAIIFGGAVLGSLSGLLRQQ
jgi:hypothetical protein